MGDFSAVNRYNYIKNKPKEQPDRPLFGPEVGQTWIKRDGGLYIRLDRRLVPSYNVVIWEASFFNLGRTEVVQITQETLIKDYYEHEGMIKRGNH